MKKTATVSVCMNPGCGKQYAPGHYGIRQLVCTGGVLISCPKCHGTGQRDGEKCPKCLGKKKITQSCKEWYRHHYAQTRKPPRGIPDDVLDRLIAAVAKKPFWHSYLVVASRSGMRKGEMLGLTWADVLEKKAVRSTISVRGQWDGQIGAFRGTKTRQSRTAFLLDDARHSLTLYMHSLKNLVGRVWNASESGVWRWFRALQRRLKVTNPDTGLTYRVHDLRHSAALRTYRATKDITRAQVLLGHRSPATTQIYAQERPEVFLKTLEDSLRGTHRDPD